MRLGPEAAHALAGEFVLGTLRGPARRRFEAMVRADPRLADVVRRWEEVLVPLAQPIAPVEPPARVWRAIEARIDAASPRRGAAGSSFWDSVAFWRPVGLLAGGLATMLLAFFLYISTGPRGEPVFVAVLTEAAPGTEVRTVVSMHSPDLLRVRVVKPWEASGRSLELWVLPREGKPRSLGLVANAPGDTLIEITATDPRVQGATALAISMEPPGGSPSGAPTGPVVASGVIAPVKRT